MTGQSIPQCLLCVWLGHWAALNLWPAMTVPVPGGHCSLPLPVERISSWWLVMGQCTVRFIDRAATSAADPYESAALGICAWMCVCVCLTKSDIDDDLKWQLSFSLSVLERGSDREIERERICGVPSCGSVKHLNLCFLHYLYNMWP